MAGHQRSIGQRFLPPRFLLFCLVAAVAVPIAITRTSWSTGTMIGFDIAALVFLGGCAGLLFDTSTGAMRAAARANDANRGVLLVIASFASVAVLAAVAAELGAKGAPKPVTVALVVTTLVLSWLFGNMVYALHYAHLYYLPGDGREDARGLDVPGTDEPDYWDFIYFAFTLGMTFQTSDVDLQTGQMRRVATAHCMAAFVFNLGVVAFTINVLGGA